MSLTVAIVAYNRPGYLTQALYALSQCRGFHRCVDRIVASVDDSRSGQAPCVGLLQEWLGQNCDETLLIQQARRRGIVGNSVLALKAAFDSGADNVFYLEDDAVLAPDALELAEWFTQQNHSRYLAYGLSRGGSSTSHDPRLMAEQSNHPCPYAWVVNKANWPFILENWCCKNYHPCGWSWSMTHAARLVGRAVFLGPELARVKNIGRDGGANGRPEDWDAFHRDEVISNGLYRPGISPCLGTGLALSYSIESKITDREASCIDDWMLPEINKDPRRRHDGWLGFGRPGELG